MVLLDEVDGICGEIKVAVVEPCGSDGIYLLNDGREGAGGGFWSISW